MRDNKRYLKDFVEQTEYLYYETATTFNMHQLPHLVQSILDWGQMWAHSGYTFESGSEKIFKKVHAAKGVIHQIVRVMTMIQLNL